MTTGLIEIHKMTRLALKRRIRMCGELQRKITSLLAERDAALAELAALKAQLAAAAIVEHDRADAARARAILILDQIANDPTQGIVP